MSQSNARTPAEGLAEGSAAVPAAAQPWFDAHLDLACMAEVGRDLSVPAEAIIGSTAPAAVTFPALAEGQVRTVLGTLFIQRRVPGNPDADGPWCYSSEEEAHLAALRQVTHYLQWQDERRICLVRDAAGLAGRGSGPCDAPLRAILLMEGAAGVRHIRDLETFYNAGVRVLSLTWLEGTTWAGGDRSGGDVSAEGRDLIAEMDRLGIVHDVSHLSEEAFWSVMRLAKGKKIASHSNCRALLPWRQYPERHLSDEQIRALIDAGGMIGLNLFSRFLVREGRGSSQDVARHAEHIEKLTGRRDVIGLGSDMDGGFTAAELPADLDHPRKLPNLLSALHTRGWSDAERRGFAYDNWARFFSRALPGT